nr:helix-turn-helix domain-containing protein [Kibdelosporangium sp. MJ126-NF4]
MDINDERLTVAEFCAEWKVARSTFYRWLAVGEAPDVIKLPNGKLRIARSAVAVWENARRLMRVEVA